MTLSTPLDRQLNLFWQRNSALPYLQLVNHIKFLSGQTTKQVIDTIILRKSGWSKHFEGSRLMRISEFRSYLETVVSYQRCHISGVKIVRGLLVAITTSRRWHKFILKWG